MTASPWLGFGLTDSFLGGCDALLDERIPIVTMRTLPEQLGTAVAAADADVGIEVEDRVFGEVAIAID